MSKRAVRERMAAKLSEPSTLESLTEFITSGGTLAMWCTAQGFLYGDTYVWIYDDQARLALYTKALEAHRANLTDRVTAKLTAIMDQDVRAAFDNKGRPLPVNKLPDAVAGVLAGVDHTTDGRTGTETVKLRMTPRDRGAEMLGRHLGMFKDKLEVTGDLGIAGRLAAARKRQSPGAKK